MRKHATVLAILLLLISARSQGWTAEWTPSRDWIRIGAPLFVGLASWTRDCSTPCYVVYFTQYKEEIGYYINKKTKDVVSVEIDDKPAIRFLSR